MEEDKTQSVMAHAPSETDDYTTITASEIDSRLPHEKQMEDLEKAIREVMDAQPFDESLKEQATQGFLSFLQGTDIFSKTVKQFSSASVSDGETLIPSTAQLESEGENNLSNYR